MDAQWSTVRPLVGRGAGITFGLATQAFFVATVWGLFWYLYGSSVIPAGHSSHWAAVDLALALQFAIVHSWLLLPATRARISKQLPAGLFGSLFCVVTCAGLWLIICCWQSSEYALWDFHGAAAYGMRAAFFLSWIGLFYSLSLSGFGYQTGWTQWLYWLRREKLPRRGLVDRGAYRWLRHPAYLSFLGLIWFTPRMTLDHALLTGVWTFYIFVGSVLKDRRLAYYLGEEYCDYAGRVPGYPGMWIGPLARWARMAETREPARRAA
ncbi:MAG: isoprenylcysteine carboxylmethyltransferase family protein [Pirellulales bacterium]